MPPCGAIACAPSAAVYFEVFEVGDAVESTQVCIGMMDSRRPEGVATVPVHHLSVGERLGRATRRLLLICGGGLLVGNIGLFMFPFPHLHLCVFPFALIFGPLVAWFGWESRVVLGSSALACPRCHGTVDVPAGLVGWPARFNCGLCAIMIELKPARDAGPSQQETAEAPSKGQSHGQRPKRLQPPR